MIDQSSNGDDLRGSMGTLSGHHRGRHSWSRDRAHLLVGLAAIVGLLVAIPSAARASGGDTSVHATAVVPAAVEAEFTGVVPVRLMDTRSDPAYHVGSQHRFGPSETQQLTVAGVGLPAPVGAAAVVVNVTAVAPTAASHVDV